MTRPLATILIADSYDVVRRGVRLLAEADGHYHVVGEASDGVDALRIAQETEPKVAVIDYSLPRLSGAELIHRIRLFSPHTEVLVHTDLHREDVILDAVHAGAKGFVLKDDPEADLVAALDSLSLGRPYISKQVSEVVVDRFLKSQSQRSETCLSHRERHIVQLIAEGRLNKQIGHELNISIKTVETHRANAMHKLSLRTTADLVRYAIRNGLVRP